MLESVDYTREVVGQVNGRVDTINTMMQQIELAAESQSRSTSEIAGNVEKISTMETENAGKVSDVNNGLQELSQLSHNLERLVSQFKV